MTEIQNTIREYLKGSDNQSDRTMKTFVGMIETGEATVKDFESAGGIALAKRVTDLWWHSS